MMGWDWTQMMPWQWGAGGMWWGSLAMVSFWGLLIFLIVWGVRALAGTDRWQPPVGPVDRPPQTALEILQARYARGEISRDEFETVRRDLQGS